MRLIDRFQSRSEHPIRTRIGNRIVYTFVALSLLPQLALAQQNGGSGLPTVSEPTGGGGDGGIIGTIQGYGSMIAILAGLLLATTAFFVVAGGAIAQFGEARQRQEWGGFMTTVIIGAGLVVVVIWLVTQASTIL